MSFLLIYWSDKADLAFLFLEECPLCVICVLHLKPGSDPKKELLCWPFPSGTRVEGPAGHGEAGRSPGKRGTGASGLLWGSESEVFGSHPDWPAPPSPHCPLREIYGRWFLCLSIDILFDSCVWLQTLRINRRGSNNTHWVKIVGKGLCEPTLLMTVQVNYLL